MKTSVLICLISLIAVNPAMPQCGSRKAYMYSSCSTRILESEWNEIDNMLLSDTEWEPSVDGIQIRVKALTELEYGQPLMLKLYFRVLKSNGSEILHPNFNIPDQAGIVIHLEKIEEKGRRKYMLDRSAEHDKRKYVVFCRQERLEKMKFWKKVLKKKREVIDSIDMMIDIWHQENFNNPASYRPGGWRDRPEPGPIVVDRAIGEGRYQCWLEVMLPHRSKKIWSGILTSGLFNINVSPEYYVTEPIELRIPSRLIFGLGPLITYLEDDMETVIIHKRKGFMLTTFGISFFNDGGGPAVIYGGLPNFQYSRHTSDNRRLNDGNNKLKLSYRILESSHGVGHGLEIGGYGARTIWEKEYEIHFTREDFRILSGRRQVP